MSTLKRDKQTHAARQAVTVTDSALNHNAGRRKFIRTTAGGVIMAATAPTMLAGCSTIAAVPGSAVREVDFDDDRMCALSHAILAPNPHNLQPWLVDLSKDNKIVISIDPARVLPETDPDGSQIMIGTGAMIGLLELAAAHKGYSVKTEWVGRQTENGSSMMPVGTPLVRAVFSQ